MARLLWFGKSRKKEITDKVMGKLETYAQAVTAEAKRLCPVDTGQLRNSIGYTIRRGEMIVSIHADQSYARFVEFGTRRMRARPFIRPAIAYGRKSIGGSASIKNERQFGGAKL